MKQPNRGVIGEVCHDWFYATNCILHVTAASAQRGFSDEKVGEVLLLNQCCAHLCPLHTCTSPKSTPCREIVLPVALLTAVMVCSCVRCAIVAGSTIEKVFSPGTDSYKYAAIEFHLIRGL